MAYYKKAYSVKFFLTLFLICVLCVYLSLTNIYPRNQNDFTNVGMNNSEQANRSEQTANESMCKGCMKVVPHVIIQYGLARSASTLQFHTLCLMMVMLHEDDVNSVRCFYDKVFSDYTKYTVVKTHTISLPNSLPPNTWVFMTSRQTESSKEEHMLKLNMQKLKSRNFPIQYTADIEMVSKRGIYIAYEYKSILGLSEKQMVHIVEYLRYWDVLRLCCGKQMSEDWRNKLSQNKSYTNHHELHGLTYPACEMYNITQVELLMINSYIYQRMKGVDTLRNFLGKPALVDGTLDGQYCERCNKNISKFHLKINENCG